MRKTFKYRLFLTPAQKTAAQHLLGICCWVYNKTLETRRDVWKSEKKNIRRYDTHKMLTAWKKEYPFLYDGNAQVMQDVQKRVDLAFRAFFRRVKAGQKPGFPRFKSYLRYDSFTYPQSSNWNFLSNDKLRISKVGVVRISLHCPLEGRCKTLTIRRDNLGKWYACFSCIVDINPLPITDKVVGVDMGLTHFATLSNGEQIAAPKFFRQDETAIAKVQRNLSKSKKGTLRRYKYLRVLHHIHERIANRRYDFSHKISRNIIDTYQLIVFEDLNVGDMLRNHRLAKSIADAAWGQLIRFTIGKAEGAGRTVVLVDPRNTSQLCSTCGMIVSKPLSVRTHECPKCGLVMDRDKNAALNILARGLACLGESP